MCGFAALFSSSGSVKSEPLAKAAQSLEHRGPDNQSVWVDERGVAGLAHARLSLLDLSRSGDQPLTSSDGSLKLIHNGEFYDFERIKRDLEAKGHSFRTKSDSEILLPLYQDLGTAALSKLRGEFAFVLWDRANHQVFAARDRFGIKPLFYAVHQGRLHFASEVKALFAMGVPAQWDYEMAYQFHTTWVLPPHRTLYRNVYQIPPGHFLLASEATGFVEPTVQPYWDFDYPTAAERLGQKLNAEDEVLRLREKFKESVALRLRADVPVACYLSGGLDSCSVLGASAQMSSVPIHAFTLSFPDDVEYDEAVVAREMTASCGAVYHEIPLRYADLADNFADALWNAEVPFGNTHGVAKFLLSRAVRKAGFKAVLTGEGSDEIFGGYVHFRKDVLMHDGRADQAGRLEKLTAANAVSRPLMLASELDPSLTGLQRTLGFVPSFIAAQGQRSQATAIMRDEFKGPFAGRDAWRSWLNHVDVARQVWGREPLDQSLYLWSRTMLPAYLLTVLGDRMEMAHSIEGRLPFLDHELVEHVVKLPPELKIQGDLTEKFLLREAARPFLTDTVYKRQKHPFLAPPAAASPESALFGLVQDTFRSAAFAASPFYDQAAVIKVLDRVPSMSHEEQTGVDGMLMNLLSFTLLEKGLGIAH